MFHLNDLVNTQYGIHFLIVSIVAGIVGFIFAIGVKRSEEPPFGKLSSVQDEKKPGKKRKVKDKKSQPQNGHVVSGNDSSSGGSKKEKEKNDKKIDKRSVGRGRPDGDSSSGESPIKEKAAARSPAKNALKETKDNKKESTKSEKSNKVKSKGKENIEVKKKTAVSDDRSLDDEGEWEQALSRKDKMKRKAALEEIGTPQKTVEKKKEKQTKKKVEQVPVVEVPVSKTPDPEIVKEEKPKEIIVDLTDEHTEIELGNTESKSSKKNKKKKEKDPVAPAPVEASPVPVMEVVEEVKPHRIKAPEVIEVEKKQEENLPVVESSSVVFDELADTWKEAKATKKSTKKKTRKD